MALNNEESRRWIEVEAAMAQLDYKDPIELAADDLRVRRAAEFLILGTETLRDEDCAELLAQVAYEYIIEPMEVLTALELAEDRISQIEPETS